MPLTAEQRHARAVKAAQARHGKRALHAVEETSMWESMTIEEAKHRLAFMRADIERGSVIIQRRIGELASKIICVTCSREIPAGRWFGKHDRKNPVTGLFETEYTCSRNCEAGKNLKRQGLAEVSA